MFDFKDTKEKLLTSLVFTGIFLPVRLFFYIYVTQWWLGSFGLITGIMITLLYFSKKGKLGKLGDIINRQVTRIAKGKAGISFIIVSVILLTIFGNMLYGMSSPPKETVTQLNTMLEDEGITDWKSYTAKAKDVRFDDSEILLGLLAVFFIMFVPTEPGHALFSIINGWTNAWLQHFVTVWFVQELEVLGLVIYFRYVYKNHY